MLKKFPAILLALLIGITGVFAQDAQVRTVASGQKIKLKGVVVARDNDRVVVRDATGVETNVMLTSATSVKTKGGFFGGGDTVATNQIVRGLNLEIEGRGDNSGNLSAQKVRFGKTDLATATAL